jgi:predicted aspartyl protease
VTIAPTICRIEEQRPRNKIEILIQLFKNPNPFPSKALVDSGAGGNFIDKEFAEKHFKLLPLTENISVYNVDGTPNKSGEITDFVRIVIKIMGQKRRHSFLAMSLRRLKIILGYHWLKDENPDINWKEKTIKR